MSYARELPDLEDLKDALHHDLRKAEQRVLDIVLGRQNRIREQIGVRTIRIRQGIRIAIMSEMDWSLRRPLRVRAFLTSPHEESEVAEG